MTLRYLLHLFLCALVGRIGVVCSSSVRRITEQYKQLVVQIPGYSPTEVKKELGCAQ